MELSIAALLASFAKDKTHTLKGLEKKLHCNDEASQRDLQIAVDALERIGVLVKERGKYRRELSSSWTPTPVRDGGQSRLDPARASALPFKTKRGPTTSTCAKAS